MIILKYRRYRLNCTIVSVWIADILTIVLFLIFKLTALCWKCRHFEQTISIGSRFKLFWIILYKLNQFYLDHIICLKRLVIFQLLAELKGWSRFGDDKNISFNRVYKKTLEKKIDRTVLYCITIKQRCQDRLCESSLFTIYLKK